MTLKLTLFKRLGVKLNQSDCVKSIRTQVQWNGLYKIP